MMYFTIWHYIVAIIFLILLVLTLFVTFKSVERKSQLTVAIVSILVFLGGTGIVFSIMDKYLKEAEVSKLQINKRNGKVYYSGYVKNIGSYTIGYVKLSVELVNRGDIDYYEPGTMYKPKNGLADLFTNDTKVQQVSDDFIIAKDLPPGSTKYFNVYMSYPKYFTKTADKTSVKAH